MYGSGKEQSEENIVKSIINLFKLKKIEVIKDRIIRYIGPFINKKIIIISQQE